MASDFQLIPTPNPLEFMVALTVPDRVINDNLKLLPGGALLAEYTPYKQFTWAATKPRVEEFGNYRYVFSEKPAGDFTRFYFAKPRTEEEKNTPFKTIKSTRQYVWPAVLLELYFVRSTFSLSNYNGTTTQNAPRYLPRYRFVPTTSHDSIIVIEQFLSDTPWPESVLRHPQPLPTDIDGNYLGVSVNFPRCLHRRVVLPELVPGATVVLGAGMEGSDRNGTPREQVFPETNFSNWVEFYIEDVVQPQRGMYLRERVKIKPPPQGEATQI